MKKNSYVVVLGLMFLLLVPNPLHACVGRLLVVAVGNSTDQIIMGQMLSILINERTGTTVDVIQEGDLKKCHEKVLKGNADIYISYIGMAQASTGSASKAHDPQAAYTLVRQWYMEKLDMVWLKPFGFKGPVDVSSGKDHATLAAPVVTRDVLKRFPVLDRVINKLGGNIDDNTMDELRKKAENQDIKETVREFLRTQRMI